jgi:hypothetical protein
MSRWLDPTGRSTYGIGLCDRCHEKFFLEDLLPDPNSPGLRVCRADRDEYDPYRLPARQTENIALRFTRPDEPLTGEQLGSIYALSTEESVNDIITTEDGDLLELEGVVE